MCFPRNTNPLPAITYKLYLKLSYEFHVHILNIPHVSQHTCLTFHLTICCITGAGKLTDAATSSGMFCEDNDLSSLSLLVVEFDTVSDTDEGLSTAGGVRVLLFLV